MFKKCLLMEQMKHQEFWETGNFRKRTIAVFLLKSARLHPSILNLKVCIYGNC